MKICWLVCILIISNAAVTAQVNNQSELSAANRIKGNAYAEKQMAGNPEIKKTSTGLVYQVVKQGSGEKPSSQNVVSVKYKGSLIDGTVFDQTTGSPASFSLNQVITGWTEGLQLMAEGSTFIFIIPSDLAYGDNPPSGYGIEPGSTLIFEVELIKIKK